MPGSPATLGRPLSELPLVRRRAAMQLPAGVRVAGASRRGCCSVSSAAFAIRRLRLRRVLLRSAFCVRLRRW